MDFTDQSELREFISQRIDYTNNPQSFRYQLEQEINNHLKRQQQVLKHKQIKMRNQKIQKEQADRRKKLQEQIAKKGNKGAQKKIKLLEERVKSMSQLRKRKEEFAAEKIKQSRKQTLKKSLEKIKMIEKQREDSQLKKLMKTQSDSRLTNSLHISRLQKRNQNKDAEYQALVQRLHSKGIFSQPNPNRKALSLLYTQKVKHIRSQAVQQEDDKDSLLLEKLRKIEGARERKETILKDKSERLKREQKFQRQLKMSKLKELEAQEKNKNKKMQLRDAMKLLFVQQLKQTQQKKYLESRLETPSFQQGKNYPKIKESKSFKEQIRRQIQIFKQNHS